MKKAKKKRREKGKEIIAIKNAIMSFVITNNVHYYDLTWKLDITFIFASAKAIKRQLQSFSTSFISWILAFDSVSRQSLAFSYNLKENKKVENPTRETRRHGIEWKFPTNSSSDLLHLCKQTEMTKKCSWVCKNSNDYALHFHFASYQTFLCLSILMRLLIDKVCRHKVHISFKC